MTDRVIFVTHANVVIDPKVPVPQWPLSDQGRARHDAFARSAAVAGVTSLFCSHEVKATDAAQITGDILSLVPHPIEALGENDRSATGYLPQAAFEATRDRFFASPEVSIDGWERAIDAQNRIVGAVRDALSQAAPTGTTLIIGHGGTAALLRCYLKRIPITGAEDQPPVNGGCWYAFAPDLASPPTEWSVI